jgi:ABC-2 type transport system permease protein
MNLHILLILLKKDLLEQWRTKKILILAIIFLFVAISSPIMAKILPELMKSISVPGMVISLPSPTYLDAIDQYIKNISQIAILVVIFIVAGAICDEKTAKLSR